MKKTDQNDEEKMDMENIFFNEVKNGEKTCLLTNILDQLDLLLIKSLFQSEQIPYYVEFKHFSSIYPFLNIGTLANENIYILEKDYDDVIKLIEEYKTKK